MFRLFSGLSANATAKETSKSSAFAKVIVKIKLHLFVDHSVNSPLFSYYRVPHF